MGFGGGSMHHHLKVSLKDFSGVACWLIEVKFDYDYIEKTTSLFAILLQCDLWLDGLVAACL
jgi:hypothetical protein